MVISQNAYSPSFSGLVILVYMLFLGIPNCYVCEKRYNKEDKTKALSYALTFAKRRTTRYS
jgi:uncharacterized protein (UPF0333 family)